MAKDKDLELYRTLMPTPTRWEDGFSVRSVIGCIFIGLVMMPASMYLSLLMGGGLSDAARWVTVVLFVELARRSYTTLSRPEIFVLFYMAGAVLASPFSSLLWTQYFVTSDAAIRAGITENMPRWVAPGPDVIAQRTFFHVGWLGPIAMIVLGQFLGRIDRFGLGYVLFRVTSDVERLPFPMAPIGASGVTALAESSSATDGGAGGKTTSWRWRVFSIGGMLGLVFGALYVGIPALSSIFLKKPIFLLEPIFVDFTPQTQSVLPATPVTLSMDLGNILVGMVLPFWAVLGSFVGLLVTWIANPILHQHHVLHQWTPEMNAIDTDYANYQDFYLSFGIGIALAVAAVGFFQVFRSYRKASAIDPSTNVENQKSKFENLFHPPAGRGDISIFAGIGIYLFSTTTYIVLCHFLVPDFPLWILLAYGFVYTPIISYVASRMEGIVGQWTDIPMLREATFIASSHLGYRGVGIWFAPIPMSNYHGAVVDFRTQELTGTKFTSLFKAELVLFPVVIISSFLCAQYLWKLAPIPSAQYPYANRMFEPAARRQALMQSSTLGSGHGGEFAQAIQWKVIGASAGVGLLVYSALAALGAPSMLTYGLIRGLGAGISPGLFPQMVGALLARYFFEKRFGLRWREYAPVLLAGFSCGMGLISMFSLGCLLISKAVFQMPY